ncbi:MAG: hypothetical protein ACK6DX_17350 [Acidobacteriota bacterium]
MLAFPDKWLAIERARDYAVANSVFMSSQHFVPLLFAVSCACILFVTLALVRRRGIRLLDVRLEDDLAGDRESISEYYRPMARLLDNRELNAVRSLSYISAADFRRFRAGRVEAFRGYLKGIRLDFNRIEFKLRYMMLSGNEADAKLVMDLNRMKVKFQRELLRVELHLVLFRMGAKTVDVGGLVDVLEQFEAVLTPCTATAVGNR